jgi:3-dehydroquinate synthetase
MIAAALLGHEMKITRADDVSRIVALVRRMGPLPPWPRVSPRVLMQAMLSDKKTMSGKLRFVLTPRIGEVATYENAPLEAVERALHFAPQLLSGAGKLHA